MIERRITLLRCNASEFVPWRILLRIRTVLNTLESRLSAKPPTECSWSHFSADRCRLPSFQLQTSLPKSPRRRKWQSTFDGNRNRLCGSWERSWRRRLSLALETCRLVRIDGWNFLFPLSTGWILSMSTKERWQLTSSDKRKGSTDRYSFRSPGFMNEAERNKINSFWINITLRFIPSYERSLTNSVSIGRYERNFATFVGLGKYCLHSSELCKSVMTEAIFGQPFARLRLFPHTSRDIHHRRIDLGYHLTVGSFHHVESVDW